MVLPQCKDSTYLVLGEERDPKITHKYYNVITTEKSRDYHKLLKVRGKVIRWQGKDGSEVCD